jgi:hypothetical protein
MGWSLSWVAVRGRPAEQVWSDLGLRPTGRVLEVPLAPFSSTVVNGWVLVCADGDRFVKDSVLRSLSDATPVVACYVEEHVTHSQAVSWGGGSRRWSVLHDEDHGEDHLMIEGDPPRELAAIAAGARTGEPPEPGAWRSFFDVPVDLAEALVGFRYDADHELSFQELEPTRPLARAAIRHRTALTWLKLLGAIALFLAGAACIGAVKRWLVAH